MTRLLSSSYVTLVSSLFLIACVSGTARFAFSKVNDSPFNFAFQLTDENRMSIRMVEFLKRIRLQQYADDFLQR